MSAYNRKTLPKQAIVLQKAKNVKKIPKGLKAGFRQAIKEERNRTSSPRLDADITGTLTQNVQEAMDSQSILIPIKDNFDDSLGNIRVYGWQVIGSIKCAKCSSDTNHDVAVFCANPECSETRPAGQAAICLRRAQHNHFCIKCAAGINEAE